MENQDPTQGLTGADLSTLQNQGQEVTSQPVSQPVQEQPTTSVTQTPVSEQPASTEQPVARPVIQDDAFIMTASPSEGFGVKEVEPGPGSQGADQPVAQPAGEEYTGPGLVIENKPQGPQTLPPVGGPSLQNATSYLNNAMESDIAEARAAAELKQKELEAAGLTKDPEQAAKDAQDAFDTAVVIIDKIGMGTVNFTDAERAKLERSKKIRLEEVETVQLNVIKSKKPKKDSVDTILKRKVSARTTPIVNPASGYTAMVKGCSTYELISLAQENQNQLIDAENKWSVIHSKTDSTSIGDMNFNDFLKATAAVEYNNYIFGLLCATYPEDDKLPLNCLNPECRKEFDHKYSVKSLIRIEKAGDKLRQRIGDTIDGSHTVEGAQAVHRGSILNSVKKIQLPESEFVFELHLQSAYDMIYTSIKGLQDNKDAKYNQAAILSTSVRTVYITDDEDAEGGYLEFQEPIDIAKVIYSLGDTDILVLTKEIEKFMDDVTFEYGLLNVKCPHCGFHRESVTFDIETILFYRRQQAMSTAIE